MSSMMSPPTSSLLPLKPPPAPLATAKAAPLATSMNAGGNKRLKAELIV